MRKTAIKLSIDDILGMADAVGQLNSEVFTLASTQTLNEVVDRAYDLARDRITEGVNLSDEYLRRRMSVEHASNSSPEASITAHGSKSNMTRLFTYDAQMVIVPRTTTRKSRSKGILGFPSDSKQRGVNVTVMHGSTKGIGKGFVLPLRAGTELGDKRGVFMREGDKLKHLYGPSVYQLFAYQAKRIEKEVGEDLEKTFLDRVDAEVRKITQ